MEKYDFSGWATRNNIKCADGRVILKDAFKHHDGQTVPMVWMHQHNDPNNVLGHAILENREEGVYAYGVFNDTEAGKQAKLLVQHGDVDALSIYANRLKQQGQIILDENIWGRQTTGQHISLDYCCISAFLSLLEDFIRR